jgi:hypothetical protein
MKKIFSYIFITLGAVFFPACNDYLETVSPSSNSVDATFASPTDTYNALMGVYALMCEDAMYSSRISLFWMTNTDIEITAMGTSDYRNADRRGLSNYGSRPTIDMPDITNPWEHLYNAISRVNLCIVNIPESQATKGEYNKQMMAYYGEALTLRALFYMELCRQWGDVPFRTEPATPQTFYVDRTDRDVIYEHLLDDLAEAEKYLPWVTESESGSVERVSKGFALGLTARIAMYRAGYSLRRDGQTRQGSEPEKYYQIAKDACQRLIAEGPHRLTPNFHDYFITQCRNQLDNNYESLFEVGFGVGHSGEVGYSIGTKFDPGSAYYGSQNTGYVTTTPVFLYSYDPSDVRRDVTVNIYLYQNATSDDVGTGPIRVYRQKIVSSPSFRIGKWSLKHLTGAALSGSVSATAKYFNGINWPIMRLADVYLLLAEAEYRLNGVTGVAQEALKTVRRRAFKLSEHTEKVDQYVASLSGDAFFEAIVNERAWELAGEGVRKYDLVRWNLLANKLQECKEENLAFVTAGQLPNKYPNSRYNPIPSTLYYKFDYSSNHPEIDMSTLDLYRTPATIPSGPDDYSCSGWVTITGKTLTDYTTWFEEQVNYGYDPNINNHLFAFPSTVISTAGGLWNNDTYWSQL